VLELRAGEAARQGIARGRWLPAVMCASVPSHGRTPPVGA
jgi:hypothetical protein